MVGILSSFERTSDCHVIRREYSYLEGGLEAGVVVLETAQSVVQTGFQGRQQSRKCYFDLVLDGQGTVCDSLHLARQVQILEIKVRNLSLTKKLSKGSTYISWERISSTSIERLSPSTASLLPSRLCTLLSSAAESSSSLALAMR